MRHVSENSDGWLKGVFIENGAIDFDDELKAKRRAPRVLYVDIASSIVGRYTKRRLTEKSSCRRGARRY